jgi:hypothetical protein
MAKPPAEKPRAKAEKKPKLTDAERHKRFVDMAHEVEADEGQQAFSEAFDRVVRPKVPRAAS